jgi:multiple sugar transport system substrate-binding protein
MRHRRLAAAATAAALTLSVISACGRGSGSEDTTAKAVSDGKATGDITVWAMGTEGEKLAAFAKQFTAENPGAKVNVTAVPWDAAHQKIASAIAAKQTPDVSMIGTTDQGEFAKTGALDPTPTDLFKKPDFFAGAWDTTVVDGTSFAVPWYVETRGIYYRKDLAKAGFPDGPKTWDDLKNMTKAMQTKAGAQWGINLQPGKTGSWQSVLPFAWSAGADIAAGGKYTFDTPEMIQGLKYYQSFFTEKIAPTDLAQGALEPAFVKGRIGAFMSGPWHVGILADQGGTQLQGQVRGRADADRQIVDLVHRRLQLRRLQGRQEPRRRLEVPGLAVPAADPGEVVPDRQRPARGPVGVERPGPRLRPDAESLRGSAEVS